MTKEKIDKLIEQEMKENKRLYDLLEKHDEEAEGYVLG